MLTLFVCDFAKFCCAIVYIKRIKFDMRVAILGALGRMGSMLSSRLEKESDILIVARVDNAYTVVECGKYKSLDEVKEDVDVLVNFAHHSLAFEVADFVKYHNVALCEFCTGHTQKERKCIENLGEFAPVFFASNTALGIAHIVEISKRLASVFPHAQVEIVETHHSQKADAPSGTALMLANEIAKVRGGDIVCGRQEKRGCESEIGIHSIRLGDAFGEHSVYVDTGDEKIILSHIALSKELYCDGAERAIRFVATKEKGVYGMQDLLDEYKNHTCTT